MLSDIKICIINNMLRNRFLPLRITLNNNLLLFQTICLNLKLMKRVLFFTPRVLSLSLIFVTTQAQAVQETNAVDIEVGGQWGNDLTQIFLSPWY